MQRLRRCRARPVFEAELNSNSLFVFCCVNEVTTDIDAAVNASNIGGNVAAFPRGPLNDAGKKTWGETLGRDQSSAYINEPATNSAFIAEFRHARLSEPTYTFRWRLAWLHRPERRSLPGRSNRRQEFLVSKLDRTTLRRSTAGKRRRGVGNHCRVAVTRNLRQGLASELLLSRRIDRRANEMSSARTSFSMLIRRRFR